MSSIAVDQIDSGINNFVFEKDKTEKSNWQICNREVPRSEVVFVTQFFFIFLLLTLCIAKLAFYQLTCEESAIWVSILSSLIGYILPNPSL